MQVHPSQIFPGAPFDILYFIRNHTDATTYYVRAVVYDVRTGSVLLTQNLAQSPNNSRLFTATVQAPGDSSGLGRNIVAIATVYTDSGYTIRSTDYEEQEQYFLVRAEMPLMGGGGIDYEAIRSILDDTVSKRLKELPKPPPAAEFPSEALFGAIGALQREVNRIPKDLVETQGLSDGLASIKAAIEALPQPKEPDLRPLLSTLGQILTQVAALRDFIRQTGAALSAANQSDFRGLADQILQRVETGITDLMSRQELTIPLSKLMTAKPEPTPSPIDVSHLM